MGMRTLKQLRSIVGAVALTALLFGPRSSVAKNVNEAAGELCSSAWAGPTQCSSTLSSDEASFMSRAAIDIPAFKSCPADWRAQKRGGCWAKVSVFKDEGPVWAYVASEGWLVDPRCLRDSRFGPQELLGALKTASRKMNPAVPLSQGGCLGTYNPDWARELTAQVWSRRVAVECPAWSAAETPCGEETAQDSDSSGESDAGGASHLIVIEDAAPCLKSKNLGLPAFLFHEFLHAAGADSVPLSQHDDPNVSQYAFARDRVYGTEFLCFLPKSQVNVVQCRDAVSYETNSPRYDLCRTGFSTNFTSNPPAYFLEGPAPR